MRDDDIVPKWITRGIFISWKASRSRLICANYRRWGNGWRITVRCGIMLKGARNPALPFLNIRSRELKSRGISRIWKWIRDQASPLVSSNPSVPDAFCPFSLTAKPYTTSRFTSQSSGSGHSFSPFVPLVPSSTSRLFFSSRS